MFVAEIGDVGRFDNPSRLCSWAGLTPRHRESDTHIEPEGSPRWHVGRRGRLGAPAVRWEVTVTILGGLDIHRAQLTYDYVDLITGEVHTGRVTPADRSSLRVWLQRFDGDGDVAFTLEGCTGWLQRVHATLFHHGVPAVGASLVTATGHDQLASACLPPQARTGLSGRRHLRPPMTSSDCLPQLGVSRVEWRSRCMSVHCASGVAVRTSTSSRSGGRAPRWNGQHDHRPPPLDDRAVGLTAAPDDLL